MMKQKLEINSLIDSYKDFLIYEKGLSENSVIAYIGDINKISGDEEYFDIKNFLPGTYLKSSNNKNYSGSTKKRIQSSINQFLKYLIDKNYIDNIEVNNLSIMSEKKLPNVLSPSEINQLIEFYDHDLFLSSRNRKNKNNKFFIYKSNKTLDRTAVFRIIKSTGLKVGIHKELYPHILRHSAATHMLEGGCDLRTVQEFLGHSSVSTTQIYTKVTKAFLEEAFIESHPRS